MKYIILLALMFGLEAHAIRQVASCSSLDGNLTADFINVALSDVPDFGDIEIGDRKISTGKLKVQLVGKQRVFSVEDHTFVQFRSAPAIGFPSETSMDQMLVLGKGGTLLGTMKCCFGGLEPVPEDGIVLCKDPTPSL